MPALSPFQASSIAAFPLPEATHSECVRHTLRHILIKEQKMRVKVLPSQEVLNGLLRYDPETGLLYWKKRRSGVRADLLAGSPQNDGSLSVMIDGIKYIVTRVIWKMVYNEEPILVDHEDRNRKNNKLKNLRNCNQSQNQGNKVSENRYLPKGVHQLPNGRYRAQIKRSSLGCFVTSKEAEDAYIIAAQKEYGAFARRG